MGLMIVLAFLLSLVAYLIGCAALGVFEGIVRAVRDIRRARR
jgi:hypothetical protein